ncbi:leucine efflux protein LeuE [Chitinibacter bivalviorum]|uniref:Leucine efflux protein LeuE n=1 Tax=Chitinibacter bivalviorum TaxID=2739434 RepID=A0A7H9BHV1_9NEIS|nr:leucine efflux protein LeuE [Chitinibacter bivalviorum]QLG88119.1 leucine efflux protein LeuE [Chitinibacter bivalviorum]
MFGITDLWAYLLGTVLIILAPGPNSLFALTTAATRGRKAGFAAAAGIVVGDFILMLAAVLGVASLMKTHPVAFDAVRYLGAGYLLWIGVKALFARNTPKATTEVAKGNPAHAFRSALGISLINVKAILFFMAFFPQFVDPSYPHVWHSFAALGLIVQIVSISYLTTLILAGSALSRRLAGVTWLKTILNKLIGTLFVSFGLRLALD